MNVDLSGNVGRLPVTISIEGNYLVGYIIDPSNYNGQVALGGGVFGDALIKVSE